MAEAKSRVLGTMTRVVPPPPRRDKVAEAKALLQQGVDQIAGNVTRYGYKEDKVALTALKYALELL